MERLCYKKDLYDEPRGITHVSQDEFAISFGFKKEVVVYKIDKANNIWQHKSFKLPDKPFSISYSKKSFAVEIGEGDDGLVVITDSSGNMTHRVTGLPRFAPFTGNSIRLVHDHESKNLFIVNVGGIVHCISYNGETIWQANISVPRGLILLESLLLVACKNDNKIYQIDK